MLDLDNHVFNLVLHEEDLKRIIHDGAQKLVNQPYSLTLPILGSVLAQIDQIRSTKVQIASEQIFYDLEAELEIRPSSSLLPNVVGIVSLESSLRPYLSEEGPKVDFRILNFQWVEGPNSSKGKRLKWINRLSSQLLKNSNVIESIVQQKFSEKLTSDELEKLIRSFTPTFRIANVKTHLKGCFVRLAEIRIQPSYVSMRIGYSLRMSHEPGTMKVQVDFGEFDDSQAATLIISQQFINKILRANIGQINVLLSSRPVKVEDLALEINPQVLHISIVPSRFTEKPIELLLKLIYQPELKMIELLDCQISANEEAGMIIRGLFKLMSGKLEDAVEKYFPLDPVEKLKVLIESPYEAGPIKLHFDDLKFLDIQILQGQLKLVLDYFMQVEIKNHYLINKKDPFS